MASSIICLHYCIRLAQILAYYFIKKRFSVIEKIIVDHIVHSKMYILGSDMIEKSRVLFEMFALGFLSN